MNIYRTKRGKAMRSTREIIDNRHKSILNFLEENPACNVATMAEQLQVSPVTIRRDLDSLESQGLINRHYGGAKILGTGSHLGVTNK